VAKVLNDGKMCLQNSKGAFNICFGSLLSLCKVGLLFLHRCMDGLDETNSLWINGIGKKVIPKVLMHIYNKIPTTSFTT
jgi:hypothetical protein